MPVTKRARMSLGNNVVNASKSSFFKGSKITKPGSTTNSKEKSKHSSKVTNISKIPSVHISCPNIKKLAPVEKEYTPEEKRALQISDAQLKHYWMMKESERLVFTVHQTELDESTKILRLFDMSSQYGPCIGISRSKRWARANRLGLSPPIEVLAILLRHHNAHDTNKMDKAYVDELINSIHHPNTL